MKRVLILALPKSGTTIMYSTIKDSMPPETIGLFEPDACRPKRKIREKNKDLVAKVLLLQEKGIDHYHPEACSYYDKKIMLVRDPRDVLVSLFLYLFFHSTLLMDFGRFGVMISALLEKEKNPRGTSFLDLIRLRDRLEGSRFPGTIDYVLREMDFMRRVKAMHGTSIFQLKYEDLIDHRFDELQDYLDFDLTATTEVPEEFKRVTRTRGSGDWRNWFLCEDVAFFKPRLTDYLKEFGYPDDWAISDNPKLERAHAAGYVLDLVSRKGAFSEINFNIDALAGLTEDSLNHSGSFIDGLEPSSSPLTMSQDAEILDIHLEGSEGKSVNFLANNQEYDLVFNIRFKKIVRCPEYLISLRPKGARKGALEWIVSDQARSESIQSQTMLQIRIPFKCDLPPDIYLVSLMIVSEEDGRFDVLAHYADATVFVLTRFDSGVLFGNPVRKLID